LIKGDKQKDDKKEDRQKEDKNDEINDKTTLKQLKEMAKEKGIKNLNKYTSKNKDELIQLIKEVEHKNDKEEDKQKVEINDKTTLKQLKEMAKEKGIKNLNKYTSKNKDELIKYIIEG
jgi:hypothetical protein